MVEMTRQLMEYNLLAVSIQEIEEKVNLRF